MSTKHKERSVIRLTRDHLIPALLALSLALIIGGVNLVTAGRGPAARIVGAMLSLLGAAGCVGSYLKRRGAGRPLSSSQRMVLGGVAFLVTLGGIALTVLSAENPAWSGSALRTFCFASMIAAGAASVILMLDTQREFTLEGFSFVSGERYKQKWGFSGMRHVYEGERLGIPLRVTVSVGEPDRHGKPHYVVDTICLVDNPLSISLLAHPDRYLGWPYGLFLRRLPEVPHWERHVVRGEPADHIGAVLAPFRRHAHTIFSDAYGFVRVRVRRHRVSARFVLDTGEKHRLTDLVEGIVFFSGHFN